MKNANPVRKTVHRNRRKGSRNQKIVVVKRKTTKAATRLKENNLPCPLKPSVIRRICRLPPEKCRVNTKARIMYINSKFRALKSRIFNHKASCRKIRSSCEAPKMGKTPAVQQKTRRTKGA
ncbi:uncharacterized protein LOC108093619 isoform X2 [Drosophila ficusphila]|uniref:uncharacterized protein LOC108093619 isoform X2 n=1 Tax=Drosophila ficusphila TaxID=30025 RepID=UPI001C89484E|nr:uncharacterized protein LOC108093619 isoform X2 [Drosophila ficusphila]